MPPRRDDLIARAQHAAGQPDDAATVSAIARRLTTLEVRCARCGDPEYPAAFAELSHPPAVWFVRGEPIASVDRAVAIVGSRSASPYGRVFAQRLASDLAALGFTIVSGLARGIDAAAHEGALAAGGRTVAVLPGGLDAIVPAHHEGLASRIVCQGTLASERASGPPRNRWEFVERNRLIAALARVTVVVEAATRSGALTTAAAARSIGRTVLAVPGDLDRLESAGTLALLRSGALPCGSAADVIAALGVAPGTTKMHPRRARSAAPRASSTGATPTPADRLLQTLEPAPIALETLCARAGLTTGDLLAGLLRLEWAGLAVRHPGGRWSVATGRSRA